MLLFWVLLMRLGSHVFGRVRWRLHAALDVAVMLAFVTSLASSTHERVRAPPSLPSCMRVHHACASLLCCSVQGERIAGFAVCLALTQGHPGCAGRACARPDSLSRCAVALLWACWRSEQRTRWMFIAAYHIVSQRQPPPAPSSSSARFEAVARVDAQPSARSAAPPHVAAKVQLLSVRPPTHPMGAEPGVATATATPEEAAEQSSGASSYSNSGLARVLQAYAHPQPPPGQRELAPPSVRSVPPSPATGPNSTATRQRSLSLARVIDGHSVVLASSVSCHTPTSRVRNVSGSGASGGSGESVLLRALTVRTCPTNPSSRSGSRAQQVAETEPLRRFASQGDILDALDRLSAKLEELPSQHAHIVEFAQVRVVAARVTGAWRGVASTTVRAVHRS